MGNSANIRWVDYSIFGLSLFLIFCLLFDSFIQLPDLVAWLGKWHPLILHFPIVLLLIAVFLGLSGKDIPKKLLTVAVFAALLTAISGFFLGKETGTKGDLLVWHQWLGGSLALVAVIWYVVEGRQWAKKGVAKGLQIVLIGLVGFTGHYGGMVTHGEDFLALPKKKRSDKIPENPLIYEDVVGMILENNCVSCHNTNKRKGGLLMTSLEGLLKGGDVGNTVVPGNPENSELILRLQLPKDDKEHMPPDGKKPLNDSEIQILERWIALGASDTVRLNQLEKSEPLVALVEGLMQPDPMEKWAALPAVADSTLQQLNSDYVTVNRVAANSNALSISVFMPPDYDPGFITGLKIVAGNVVELDVSGLPLESVEFDVIAAMVNLEWLEIDGTPVTDAEMKKLGALRNLKLLKIYQTPIGDQSLEVFKNLPDLKSLYLWQTAVSKAALAVFRSDRPEVSISTGIDAETLRSFAATDSISKTAKK
ncbi:hypothetical protein FK220_019095 [Flavobacteriaceae bacterium TP-CH-4]|uniref:Cytochrome c domain-containing protein n=1 Tax=Pelagihabitans pacificus TaxID=2696054 RepID=A0A967B1M9_9FLAO|nr:c-type cytochrome domain-containing protein [Pelagihabitans pacificus]NHF61467.1 hypothetical protein [Pelagihabitans pacificus]